jgi:hypothetical protein
MAQSPKPAENKSEVTACKRNHIAIAAGLCLIALIPAMFVLAVGQYGKESSNLDPVFIFWGIYLFALAVAVWEATDLIGKEGLSSCCRKGGAAVTTGLYLTPWAVPFAFFILAPEFIMPIFRNLISVLILILIAATLWQIVGFILLIRSKSSMRSFLVILFFILPASFVILLFPLIVPAIITIVNGLCQIQK